MPRWRFPERVRSVLADVFAHHWTEMLQFKRVAFLKGLGMDESQQATRFPPSSTTIHNGGGWAKAVLAAGATAAGIYFLGRPLPLPLPTPPQQAAAPAPEATAPAAAKIQLFYEDPAKGLIPIGGAADSDGAKIQARPRGAE